MARMSPRIMAACSRRYASATVSEFAITCCVRVENHRSRPRSKVMLAATPSRTAGVAAMTENSPTILTCNLAPAWPLRRACTMCHTSRAMIPSRINIIAASTRSTSSCTWRVGSIGVSAVRTRKVTIAHSRAKATATGPSIPATRRASHEPPRSAGTAIATSSTLVIVACRPMRMRNRRATLRISNLERAIDAFLQQCCRIETIPGRYPQSGARPYHLDFEVPDLLAEGIAVDAKEIGCADLVAAGCGQGRRKQRVFHFAQDTVVQSGGRQVGIEAGKIAAEIPLYRIRQIVLRDRLVAGECDSGLRQFGIDHRGGDRFLRVERGESSREVLQFPDV